MKHSHVMAMLLVGGIGVGVSAYWVGFSDGQDLHADQRDRAQLGPKGKGAGVGQAPFGTVFGTGERDGSSDPPAVSANYDQALATLKDLRAAMADDVASEAKDRKVQAMLQGLLTKASGDSQVLGGVMDQFRADPMSPLGQHLRALLAEIKDPEVEQMAQQMAQSRDARVVMAGLDLLGDLKIASKQTFDIASQWLAQPQTDPEVLMRAINAMPVLVLPEQEATQALAQLAQLATQHPNDGVRSNSLFKISEWAKDAQDLAPVIGALKKGRPTDDRISAAMAIAQSRVVDDNLRAELLSRVSDKAELWEVRRYAAESLERFKLSGRDFEQFQAFKREQVDLQTQG